MDQGEYDGLCAMGKHRRGALLGEHHPAHWSGTIGYSAPTGVAVPFERLEFGFLGTDELSELVLGLKPGTTYTFAVKVVNEFAETSPLSNEVSATTTASTQTKGPTAPTDLVAEGEPVASNELFLRWDPSTDPVTPQADIRYLVYVDGKHESTVSDTVGNTETIAFAGPRDPNLLRSRRRRSRPALRTQQRGHLYGNDYPRRRQLRVGTTSTQESAIKESHARAGLSLLVSRNGEP